MKTQVELYTKAEVIKMLRLDTKRVKDPQHTLTYLVRTHQLKPLKIAGELMFTERAIRDYISLCAEK